MEQSMRSECSIEPHGQVVLTPPQKSPRKKKKQGETDRAEAERLLLVQPVNKTAYQENQLKKAFTILVETESSIQR